MTTQHLSRRCRQNSCAVARPLRRSLLVFRLASLDWPVTRAALPDPPHPPHPPSGARRSTPPQAHFQRALHINNALLHNIAQRRIPNMHTIKRNQRTNSQYISSPMPHHTWLHWSTSDGPSMFIQQRGVSRILVEIIHKIHKRWLTFEHWT